MSQEFKLVPASMLLDRATIGAINFHCGDGSNLELEECAEGILWIGTVKDDDDKEVYGLHLMTAEYPEEGSTTLVEFAKPIPPAGGEIGALIDQLDDYIARINGDDTGADATVNELRAHVTRLQAEIAALQQRLNVADQRVDELESALKFYADKEHFHFDEPEKWDSVSGEAENLLWHEEDPAYIEDGSVARHALKVSP